MQIWPWCMNAPKFAAAAAASRSASSSTTIGALPPSSSSTRLRCAAGLLGDDPARRGRAGEVDPPHRRMRDQRVDDRGRRRRGSCTIRLTTPGGRPASCSARRDRGVRARALLRRLEHHGVAVGQRRRHRARAEDHRRVPRRDAGHDAGRLADAHRQQARDVGRDDLADQAVRLGGRFAQHAGGERAVEHPPAERAAGLLGHRPRRSPASAPAAGRPRGRAARGARPAASPTTRGKRGPRGVGRARARPRGRRRRPVVAPTPSTGPELSHERPEPAGTHSPPISSCCCCELYGGHLRSPPIASDYLACPRREHIHGISR